MANQSDKSPFGVGHDGRPKGVPNAPGMHTPARGADAFKGHHVPGNLARNGAPKNHHDVPVHGGMTARQTALKGMGHANATAPDANPASPVSKEPQGKRLTPVQPVPGQRSRTTDTLHAGAPGENHARGKANPPDLKSLGAAVLAEALCNK
jgi:hypothetical protein